jgi:hypothetical protein
MSAGLPTAFRERMGFRSVASFSFWALRLWLAAAPAEAQEDLAPDDVVA